MRIPVLCSVLWMMCAIAPSAFAQKDVYADPQAEGKNDGSSWAAAYFSLQEAIDTLDPGDTLYSRGTFFEVVTIETEGVTWFGDSVPENPTWIRGDRYAKSSEWDWTGTLGVYAIDNVSGLIDGTLRPGSVVYDYKRDDLQGTITGIDLRRNLVSLPANGAGVYYGHLKRVTELVDVFVTPSTWFWDESNDRVYLRVPENTTFDSALAGICINGKNAVNVTKGNVRVSGVNTLCTPGFAQNKGYGLKGSGTFGGGVFENADIIDSGWHAAGYEVGSPYECTLRDIRAWSSGVDGSNANNPFIFYSLTDRDDAGHIGEDLVFHSYPLLGTNGAPIYSVFRPMLGFSHTSGFALYDLGGILWRRCHLIDYQSEVIAKHGYITYTGQGIAANDTPSFFSIDQDDYPIVVQDCVFEGVGAVPSPAVKYERCVFRPGNSVPTDAHRISFRLATWLNSCTIEIGNKGIGNNSAYINLESVGRVYMNMCTINSNSDNPPNAIFRLGNGAVFANQCIFTSKSPISLLSVWTEGWDNIAKNQQFEQCYYSDTVTPASHLSLGTKDIEWWTDNVDSASVIGPVVKFIDPTGTDLTPKPGSLLSILQSTSPITSLLGQPDISGSYYNRYFGAWQKSCNADVNRDTFLTPADFTAWIAAFNTGDSAADINGDGNITPADFSAWIAAYNAGCN